MANPRIIYNNLWGKATALAASPIADAQHPVSDTQIDTLSMFFRASAKTSPCTIPVNQGAGVGAIDFVMILAHNFESSGVVITLEGDAANTFDSDGGNPEVSRTITYNATNIFEFVTTFTKQYVRIKLVKAAGNFTDYPQVATILCGSYFELNRTVGLGYEEGYEDFSTLEYSDSQVIFAQEKEIIEIRGLPFRGLDNTTRANILLFLNECGRYKAFVICFDSADANNESIWVVNTELYAPRYIGSDCWHWYLNIKEVI